MFRCSRTALRKTLIDTLNFASAANLERHAEEKSRLDAFIEDAQISTRFLRNKFVIEPRSLQLLLDNDVLMAHRVFGIYKPAFCPMRREMAMDNFHRVSVEGYLEKVLTSEKLEPLMSQYTKETHDRPTADSIDTNTAPKEGEGLVVRVLNDIDTDGSGVVAVSINASPELQDLEHATMTYCIMVYGELKNSQRKQQNVPLELLFDDMSNVTPSSVAMSVASNPGHYVVHPVTLVRLSIQSPPSPKPPTIHRFVKEFFKSFIVGEPGRPSTDYKRSVHMVNERGDADLPRQFFHLEEMAFSVSGAPTDRPIRFECPMCFEPLVSGERTSGYYRKQIHILDGSWNANSSEYERKRAATRQQYNYNLKGL